MKSTDLSKYDDIKDDLARHGWKVEEAAAYDEFNAARNVQIEAAQKNTDGKQVVDLYCLYNALRMNNGQRPISKEDFYSGKYLSV